MKINDRFLSNTRGITLLHSVFDILTINGNFYWKRGRIDLKSKRLNSFLETAQAWETSKMQCRIVIPQVLDENRLLFFQFKSTWTANNKWYLINNKGINILIFQMTLDKVYQPLCFILFFFFFWTNETLKIWFS